MEKLEVISSFFGGVGILLFGLACLWFVAVYQKVNTPDKDK